MKKIIAIILLIVGVGLIGSGAFINSYVAKDKAKGNNADIETNSNSNEEINNENNDESNNENTNDNEQTETYETRFNNYKLKAYSTIDMYGYTTSSTIEGVVDELHQKEYLKTTTESMGIEITMETYTDFAKGITYSSVPFTNDWEKTEEASRFIDLTTIMEKFEDSGTTTKVGENEYKIKLSKEDIQGLMDSSDSAGTSTIKGDIYVHAFVEGDYVTKLEYDFSGLIEGVDKFTMTIEFSDFNNAGDVEIPKSVMN